MSEWNFHSSCCAFYSIDWKRWTFAHTHTHTHHWLAIGESFFSLPFLPFCLSSPLNVHLMCVCVSLFLCERHRMWVIWFTTSLLVKWTTSESTHASSVTSFLSFSLLFSSPLSLRLVTVVVDCATYSLVFSVHSSSWVEFSLAHLLITRITDSKQQAKGQHLSPCLSPWARAGREKGRKCKSQSQVAQEEKDKSTWNMAMNAERGERVNRSSRNMFDEIERQTDGQRGRQ